MWTAAVIVSTATKEPFGAVTATWEAGTDKQFIFGASIALDSKSVAEFSARANAALEDHEQAVADAAAFVPLIEQALNK